MARSFCGERWEEEEEEEKEGLNSKEEELEEEEALSFCDLPVKEKQFPKENPAAVETEDDEFDFNHWVGSNSSQPPPPPPPMCAADDVFFQGQMLPLRLSFSSENSNNYSRNFSVRSESMDHNMLRFRNASSSSRSSSSKSHYSRSSSLSNNSIYSIPTNSKPRAQNLFHSHPSPKPQIRSHSTSGRQGSTGRQSRSSSSRWDFFRLGLLRTPGMELQDLKNRSNNNNILSENTKAIAPKNGKPITGKFSTTTDMARQKTTGFLGVVSCKRSVETVPATPKMKSSSSCSRSSSRSSSKTDQSGKAHGIREKVMVELKMTTKKQNQKMIETQKQKQEKHPNEGEQTLSLSHRRTFEWLKQLSHASFGDEP